MGSVEKARGTDRWTASNLAWLIAEHVLLPYLRKEDAVRRCCH